MNVEDEMNKTGGKFMVGQMRHGHGTKVKVKLDLAF